MSNTPRIDACIEEYRPGTFDFAWTLIGLARQIEYECKANAEMCHINYDRAEKAERELAQAQARIEELEKLLVEISDAPRSDPNEHKPSGYGRGNWRSIMVRAELAARIDAALKEPR